MKDTEARADIDRIYTRMGATEHKIKQLMALFNYLDVKPVWVPATADTWRAGRPVTINNTEPGYKLEKKCKECGK